MRAWFTKLYLALSGWQIVGQVPEGGKAVVVAAPHTSNWDFLYLYLLSQTLGIQIRWMGKEELFKGVVGHFSRRLGGIPVKRSRSMNLVAQMVQAFEQREQLLLVVPPAATRRKTDYWKSGFYHIARGADVPVVLGFVDYGRKRAGFGPSFKLTGDVRADMDRIRAF
jgi:1-acyl-sn-glycerol-3-phosphate acyltransferase